MPPRFSTADCRCRRRPNTAGWKAGTSGAPWPPAATSRLRKSHTTSMPRQLGQQRAVAAAAPCSRCRRTRRGRWRTVWPCAPIATHLRRVAPAVASSSRTTRGIDARERVAGQRGAVQFVGAGAFSASSSARSACAERRDAHARSACSARRAAKSASTPSTPSSEVPDIRPMYSRPCGDGRLRGRLLGAAARWPTSVAASASCACSGLGELRRNRGAPTR